MQRSGQKPLRKGERKQRGRGAKSPREIALMMEVRGKTPLLSARYNYLERAVGTKLEKSRAYHGGVAVRTNIMVKHLSGPIAREIAKNHLAQRKIILPRELEFAPIHMALKRTFRSMVGSSGIMDGKTKAKIGQIIKQLHNGRKFSFKVIKTVKKTEPRKKFPMRVLSKSKKREMRKEQEKPKIPVFRIDAYVNFGGSAGAIDGMLGRKRGQEFRNCFRKYLLEEASETHWYITEKIERIVKDYGEREFFHKKQAGKKRTIK